MSSKSVLVLGGPKDGEVFQVGRDETTLVLGDHQLPIRQERHGQFEWVVRDGDRLRLVSCAQCGAMFSVDDPTHICDR